MVISTAEKTRQLNVGAALVMAAHALNRQSQPYSAAVERLQTPARIEE
jgi:hypothetical protein